MNRADEILSEFREWYNSQILEKIGLAPKGTIAGALIILDHLKEQCSLDIENHTAKGKSQVKGIGGQRLKQILVDFGENRPFLSEGGRTNRGLRGALAEMLKSLKGTRYDKLDEAERVAVAIKLQFFLVCEAQKYLNMQRLKLTYNPAKSSFQIINELLKTSSVSYKWGPVAQYLVGAKLAIKFPGIQIRNELYSTSDRSTGRAGDFQIEDTVFHVTVSPAQGLFDKCKQNVEESLRVYVIVPSDLVEATKQMANINNCLSSISVQSIEAFIGQNIDELSMFSTGKMALEFKRLLQKYNERVDAVERDKSLLIDIPSNL
jgi:hypothetical protein